MVWPETMELTQSPHQGCHQPQFHPITHQDLLYSRLLSLKMLFCLGRRSRYLPNQVLNRFHRSPTHRQRSLPGYPTETKTPARLRHQVHSTNRRMVSRCFWHSSPSQDRPRPNCPSQDYPRPNCPSLGHLRQSRPSQDYLRQNHPNQNHLRPSCPSQDYPRRNYPSQDHLHQNCPSRDHLRQNCPTHWSPAWSGYSGVMALLCHWMSLEGWK